MPAARRHPSTQATPSAAPVRTPWLRRWEAPYLCALLVGGLLIRLVLAPFGVFASDANIFRSWAARLVTNPLGSFYAASTASRPGGFGGRGGGAVDHLPGDLWWLWLIAHVERWLAPGSDMQGLGFLFLLKLVPSLADVGIGLLLFAIASRLAGPGAGLVAAAGWLLNPAAIFLSATWGQWDAVSACAMLLALWLLLRGNPLAALPALTYASLIKPQFAVLAPLALLAWWRWRVQPTGGLTRRQAAHLALSLCVSVGVFLAVDLPFSVGIWPLPTRWTIVERASAALNRFTDISANAFNLWGVLVGSRIRQDDRQAALFGLSYQHWGTLLLAVALLASLALFWRRPTPQMALWTAQAMLLALFMLPTRMHERYLLPSVVLAVLLAAIAPRLWWLSVTLTLTCLTNLVVVYRLASRGNFNAGAAVNPRLMLIVSAANLGALLAVFVVGVLWTRDGVRRQAETLPPSVRVPELDPSESPLQVQPRPTAG